MPPQATPPGAWPVPATPAQAAGTAFGPRGDGASQSTPDRSLTGPITLRAASPELLRGIATGTAGHRADWHRDYPTTETVTAAAMTLEVSAALSWDEGSAAVDLATWGLFQIVTGGIVVGDAGFHGPPSADRPRTVEIGYSVVPARRRAGIGTAACRLLLARAWAGGADEVHAETEPGNVGSRRILARCGFVLTGDPQRLVAGSSGERGAGSPCGDVGGDAARGVGPLRFVAHAPSLGTQ